jgi:hypothetical protein
MPERIVDLAQSGDDVVQQFNLVLGKVRGVFALITETG